MITVLAIPFELLRIMEGHPITFKASDGEDIVLRSDGLQARETQESARIVTVPVRGLRNAALGDTVAMMADGGETYMLRRPTIAEYRENVRKAGERLTAMGCHVPPMPTDTEIERIIYGL